MARLVSLCQNRMLKARLCASMPVPSDEEVTREVEQAVDTFLRAFGSDRRR